MSDSEPVRRAADRHASTDRSPSTKRYFFDVHDGETSVRDESGIDLSSADEIPTEAYDLLRGLVQDKLPEGQRTMTVRVRDEAGNLVYSGEMAIKGRRGRP